MGHARPAGPQLEAHRTKSRGGIFWEGQRGLGSGKRQRAPSTPPTWSGEQCKLISGVWGRALAQIDFYALFDLEMVTGGNSSY